MRALVLVIIQKIRGENIELGYFSNRDLLRIAADKTICLIRGLIFINLPFFARGFFFLGYGSILKGSEKIKFNSSATIGSRVKISSIGSQKFEFGKNFSVRDYSIIDSYGSIKMESGFLKVGNNVGISEQCYISIRGNLIIGDDVIIGPGVKIFTENHSIELNHLPYRLQTEVRKEVIIGNNVWIGASSVILPGVCIGNNVVIAAGAVVNKNVEDNTLVGGVPVKFIKMIK
jgi:acetyltransferase-like isoleucine patch superfamily enzyme